MTVPRAEKIVSSLEHFADRKITDPAIASRLRYF